jgi:heme/copper-type cytochrome/quinol oxidase subunit 3
MNAVALRRPIRQTVVSNAVLGMLIFVVTEIMFFAAFVSAFLVIKAKVFGVWAPPGDVMLPRLATGFNTAVLLASGGLMTAATLSHAKAPFNAKAKSLYLQGALLGTFFVLFQGYEWMKLISYGMTMTSGLFGATFFLLIGSHGLHAAVAVIAMAICGWQMWKNTLDPERLKGLLVFWLFVVLIWPVLYGMVYFS